MNVRRLRVTVYAAGIAQGTILVAFPATATILTSPHAYALSSTQYGLIFLPQVAFAIGAALTGSVLTQRVGIGSIVRIGLVANALSMLLYFVSRFAFGSHALAFGLILSATACLGIGFGLTVPALNALAASMTPNDADRAVLVLNALLGVGTVLAPLLAALFVGAGIWWVLPLVAAAAAGGVLVTTIGLPLAIVHSMAHARLRRASMRPLSLYIGAAFLYGFVETTSGNWGELEMRQTFAATERDAAFALAAFWGCVAVGRLTFGSLDRWLPQRRVYRILPFVAAAAMLGIAVLPHVNAFEGVVLFGLTGIGCSGLLPLTISFAQKQFAGLAGSVGGLLIASYQVGYGVAAFALGPLQAVGPVTLSAIFAGAVTAAVAFGVLSGPIARGSSER